MINTIVALSNCVGIPVAIEAFYKSPFKGAVVSSAVVASFLMHISETKHNLTPPIWGQYSNRFLWIDRVFAGLAGFTGAYYWLANVMSRGVNPVSSGCLLKMVIGVICCAIGEERLGPVNQSQYMLLHMIWHVLAYDCLRDALVILA